MSEPQLYRLFNIITYENGCLRTVNDPVVCEEELTIIVNEINVASIACSPGASLELGIGYLLSAGLLQNHTDIRSINNSEDGRLYIYTSDSLPYSTNTNKSPNLMTNRAKHSALCPESNLSLNASHLLDLIHDLDRQALTFKITGGVHSAALADNSKLLVRYEDIGRHNAVDKVFGYAFLNNIVLHDKCIVLSGRISSEIVLKVALNGIPVILSRSAPTLQAVTLAHELGMTIVGFARNNRFNVYTHWQRIKI